MKFLCSWTVSLFFLFQPMAADAKKEKLPFLKKAERHACWAARDRYWDCFERAGEVKEQCSAQRRDFEAACPATWVAHFDKRFYYLKFKKNMAETGFQKLDEDFEAKGQQSKAT